MLLRSVLIGLLLALSPHPSLRAQSTQGTSVGWYNGDRQIGIPGTANWYLSASQLARTYDNFVVPAGGWTVVAVFSNNSISDAPPVTQASWEIRSGMGPGLAGTLVASGIDNAAATYNSALSVYRIQVDGLRVALPAGTYWLNVAPVGPGGGQSWIAATLGTNAVGNPPGNDGGALLYMAPGGANFTALSSTGQGGTSADYSQGVLISGQPLTPISTADQWRSDVTTLVQQMQAMHSLPFPGISETDFVAAAADLNNRIPSLSPPEIRTEILKLVASIGDAHTDVSWPYPSPFKYVPLSFYWFDDGIYVTGAAPGYQNLLGQRLITVGKTGVDDATHILGALVPHENDQWPKKRIPQMELTNADFLFGMHLIDNIDTVPLQVQTVGGRVISGDVLSLSDFQMPRLTPVFTGAAPLYMQHPEKHSWATIIDSGATLYFQYNSCIEDPQQPSADFFKDLHQMMAQEGLRRIVLDMRNNSGGFTSILSPWIDEIQSSHFNRPGRLYVIVGRATFSAAMEATNHLHDRTMAVFVGEPTGAKPRFELRQGDFGLPYFGLRVSYSRGVESANDPGPTMVPDIQTGLTFEQYMKGMDPALDAILALPIPEMKRGIRR